MPKLPDTFNDVAESSAGEYKTLQPGVYMCRVQAVRTEGEDARGNHWDSEKKQYVKLILDIAEGEYADYFNDDYWNDESKDWGHTLYMSWKETAQGMLKHTFRSFEEANAGFDARAAFEADKWELFVGKLLLVSWNGQEYEANNGDTKVRVRPDRAVTDSDKVRTTIEQLDGTKVDVEQYHASVAAVEPESVDTYSDVPF